MKHKTHYIVRQVDPTTGEARDLWLSHKGPTWTNKFREAHVFRATSLEEAHNNIQNSKYNTPTIKCVVEEC